MIFFTWIPAILESCTLLWSTILTNRTTLISLQQLILRNSQIGCFFTSHTQILGKFVNYKIKLLIQSPLAYKSWPRKNTPLRQLQVPSFCQRISHQQYCDQYNWQHRQTQLVECTLPLKRMITPIFIYIHLYKMSPH